MLSFSRTLICMALCASVLSWPRPTGTTVAAASSGSFTAGDLDQKGQAKKHNGNGHGSDKKDGAVVVVDHNAWRDRDHCHVVFVDYSDRHGLPPGLAKKGGLPPGLRKQLKERGHLPPGIEKHWYVLPVGLERDFPPLPPSYVRRGVGVDLLVVDTRSNLVVSFMANVFIGH